MGEPTLVELEITLRLEIPLDIKIDLMKVRPNKISRSAQV
jgi:hypothetical protein